MDDASLPVVFRWAGANPTEEVNVRVWSDTDEEAFSRIVPLHHSKSDADFFTILHLPKDQYNYEFQVNGEWHYAKDQPNKRHGNRTVNTISLDGQELTSKQSNSPPGEYSTNIKKDLQLLGATKPPSQLPPHLNRALLNCAPILGTEDILPLPHLVMINHIYARPSNNKNTIIFGLTTRYKTKFVTTVFYQRNVI